MQPEGENAGADTPLPLIKEARSCRFGTPR